MNLSDGSSVSQATRAVPAYFKEVQERAQRRWQQLESDPELAGPWRQLFAQVQTPRHVLSELLQNADDAGATWARAAVVCGRFVFEHNGEDFDEDQFSSLCRFGFSNKRNLHTIGFRGIGFKSTFSLGDTVDVLTPSLAVRFSKRRFTEPIWIEDAPLHGHTTIAVTIQDPNRGAELEKNLEEWTRSPASLLFFNSLRELTIDDVTLRKDVVAPGPMLNSERVRLAGCGDDDLLVFRSAEEPFPEPAVREIQEERDTEDLHLPPCRVELVLGLPGEQSLYVVLPTRVRVLLPFSCNAPFLQDPARTGVKSPSTSPTNRWLLDRLGKLAGETLSRWLADDSLPLELRSEAYALLPARVEGGDSLEADSTAAISAGFVKTVVPTAVLLTSDGLLVGKQECISPPQECYSVWSAADLLAVFSEGKKEVLAEAVSESVRQRLQTWGWLDHLDANFLVARLASGHRPPRPKTYESLLNLWCLIHRSVTHDYGGRKRRWLPLVPVEGQSQLFAANDVVRLSSKREAVNEASWDFLVSLVFVIEAQWVEHLASATSEQVDADMGRQMLRDLGLDRASNLSEVVGKACRRFFVQQTVGLQQCVKIAHVVAAVDAQTTSDFLCVTQDGRLHGLAEGVMAAPDVGVEGLLPPEWCAAHSLHEAYFRGSAECSRRTWESWTASAKSGFSPFAVLGKKTTNYWRRGEIERLLASRQVGRPRSYPYARNSFRFIDFDFDETLARHWTQAARDRPEVWAKVVERVLRAPAWYWQDCTRAQVKQLGSTYEQDVSCDPVPAAWVSRFASLRCLSDTEGGVRAPAELYLRTPETEPLMGVEPFVRAELDTEATKPLLRLLGVRDTPAGIHNLLTRIRALAGVPEPLPLLHEIVKWYGALDRVLIRCDTPSLEEAREAFRRERLVVTNSADWATAAEVFQRSPEDDFADTPVVHPSVQRFTMWTRLGVADLPTAERVLDGLRSLQSGTTLDGPTVRRVRAALQHYPLQAWQTCRHWLALDRTWVPVDQLRFRLTMRSLTKWGDLFPTIKSHTADLLMLSVETCQLGPFSSLADLGASVQYRLTDLPRDLPRHENKAWLVTLSRLLRRVTLQDEAQTQRIREVADRLGRSFWQPFGKIAVTPYIDGVPAGQPHSPDVLWHAEAIFVRDGRLAKSFEAVVDELARPFADESVAEAIRACLDRDERFITEYMEEHFDLCAETDVMPVLGSDAPVTSQEGRNDTLEGTGPEQTSDTTNDGIDTPGGDEASAAGELPGTEDAGIERSDDDVAGHHRHPRQPSLFQRYALGLGFRWDEARQRFIHADGSWIERSEAPFQWRRFNRAGNVTTSYWASPHCLAQGGVEIAAELWELIRAAPEECCLVLLSEDDQAKALTGHDLLRKVEEKDIALYPAKYRMREGTAT